MDDGDSENGPTFATISSADTGPMDCDIMVSRLPMLSARSISVCRKAVLQQALEALGFSMNETTTNYNESNEVLTTICITVPPNIRVARLKERLFYGDWSTTTHAAVQSACFNALVYLQKVKVLTIDGIHSADLKHCQRELLRASSWAEAFQDHAAKLQSKLSEVVKKKTPGLAISQIPPKVSTSPASGFVSVVKQQPISEPLLLPSASTLIGNPDAKYSNDQLFEPSGSSKITHNMHNDEIPSDIPFFSPSKIPWTLRAVNVPRLHRGRRNFWGPVPAPVTRPETALAALNREKRKLVVDSRRPSEQPGARPSLPLLDDSSSQKTYAAVIDLSTEGDYAKPDHMDTLLQHHLQATRQLL